jgi:carboxypeptidase Q
MYRLLFTSCLVLFSVFVFAQDDSIFIRKIADEILVNGKAYDNLHTLTKTVGGRLSGSPQTYKAEEWGQKALRDAGADKVYLQQCVIPHWVRGGKDEGKLMAGSKEIPLRVLALGNSVSTSPKGIVAPALLINSFEELEQRKNEVKGKIIFYNYKFNPKLIRTFFAYADAVRYRAEGASRAAKYGAVATLVRSMTESGDNVPHTGAMVYNDSFPKIPTLAVGLLDADKIVSAFQQNKNISLFLKTNAHALPDTVGYNVIGEISGSESPEQFITVGGHLDSWDPAEGAHDDGAGCVHSIEVLRALHAVGYKPKHTIRIVLFADEENKGGGASKYLADIKSKQEKHLFALESDAGGFTPRSFNMKLADERLEKARRWIPLLQEYGVYEFLAGDGGADVSPLNDSLHVPVAELVPDSQRYFDYHHAATDVFENVNKRELELGAINMAALIYLVDKYGL